MSRLLITSFVLATLVGVPSLAAAQSLLAGLLTQGSSPGSAVAVPRQVISSNPVGILIELFNLDYERRATETVALGIGGSTAMVDTYDYSGVNYRTTYEPVTRQERYINSDVFLRYYPAGKALTGRSFGIKVGLTQVPDQGTYFGYGFDLNPSWMLNEHFYYGAGVGLKRLVGTDRSSFDLEYIPTFRLNVGVGF